MKIVRKLVIISILFITVMAFFKYVEQNYIFSNAFRIYTVDQNEVYDVKKVMEATDIPMMVDGTMGDSKIVYINEAAYEYLGLDSQSVYTNTLSEENHIFLPSKYPITILNINTIDEDINSSDTSAWVLSDMNNITNDVAELSKMTGIEFSNGIRYPQMGDTIRLFIILILLVIAEIIIYMFTREKLKTKIALLTLDGRKQKLNLFKPTCTRIFGLITLIILTTIFAIYTHSILFPILALITTIIVYFICYIFIHLYERKIWKNIDIYAIIKGHDIYSNKNKFAILTYTIAKMAAVFLIIFMSLFILNMLAQLKSLPLWTKTDDYYEISDGFVSDLESDEYFEFCYDFVKDIEENNNAMYSYYYGEVVVVNANMIEFQTDLEESYDLSKNYLVIPESKNKEEVVNTFNEYMSILEPEDVGNGYDYEVIHQKIEPLYSFDPTRGYYNDKTVYYVLGSDNTFEIMGVYSIQSDIYYTDIESVDYASYPFRDPALLEFRSMQDQAILKLYVLAFSFFLILLIFIGIFIAYTSIRNSLLYSYLNNNRIYYILKRLDGLTTQEVYIRENRLNSRTSLLCMITAIFFLFITLLTSPISSAIIVGIICFGYLQYEKRMFQKEIIKLESQMMLDVIKGKNE